KMDRSFLGHDPGLLTLGLALMALDHIHALDQGAVFLRENLQHRALLALVAAGNDDDLVALANIAHLENLRGERDDLHLVLVAQLAGDRSEDAGADRLALGIDQHRGIAVEPDQAAVGTAHALGGTDHHGLEHFALLNATARNGFLHRHHDDVADIGVPAVRTAQHLDAHHALGAAIVGDIELRGHLDHDFLLLKPAPLLADAFQHFPSLELGNWPAFLDADDIAHLELALLVMGV